MSRNVEFVPAAFYGTTETMATRWTNLKTMESEAILQIIMGEQPLDYFDTFVEQWYTAGGRTITDEIKTAGTDIDKIPPPVSRFGGGGRAGKKQGVIDKLKIFFEKYFGMDGSASFTEPARQTARTINPSGMRVRCKSGPYKKQWRTAFLSGSPLLFVLLTSIQIGEGSTHDARKAN